MRIDLYEMDWKRLAVVQQEVKCVRWLSHSDSEYELTHPNHSEVWKSYKSNFCMFCSQENQT